MAMTVSSSSAEGEPMMDINMTPLIDVMLVLLVMLIITLPPQTHAVKLDMPRPDAPPPPEQLEPLIVNLGVDFDGVYTWNGQVVSRSQLQYYLSDAAQQPRQPELHIRPHRLAEYRYVAAAMGEAQKRGIEKIGVVG